MIAYGSAWERMGELYALPGIMPQCLALQERARVSVTTLLTLVLCAANGQGAVKQATASRIARDSEAFQANVLRPLRHGRNGIGAWLDGPRPHEAWNLRQVLLDGELSAERFEQTLVLDLLQEPLSRMAAEDPLADTSRSVARYLAALGAWPDTTLQQSLAMILTAALEDYDGLHVVRVLVRALKESAGPHATA